eukprot:5935846-Alexandrium_andersonii.AAC.1
MTAFPVRVPLGRLREARVTPTTMVTRLRLGNARSLLAVVFNGLMSQPRDPQPDGQHHTLQRVDVLQQPLERRPYRAHMRTGRSRASAQEAVSYTHLTLPTICSV